jgi:hypothetical protein
VDFQHYSRPPRAEGLIGTTVLVVLGGFGLDVSARTVLYVAGWGETALGTVTGYAKTIAGPARRLEASLAATRIRRLELPNYTLEHPATRRGSAGSEHLACLHGHVARQRRGARAVCSLPDPR